MGIRPGLKERNLTLNNELETISIEQNIGEVCAKAANLGALTELKAHFDQDIRLVPAHEDLEFLGCDSVEMALEKLFALTFGIKCNAIATGPLTIILNYRASFDVGILDGLIKVTLNKLEKITQIEIYGRPQPVLDQLNKKFLA